MFLLDHPWVWLTTIGLSIWLLPTLIRAILPKNKANSRVVVISGASTGLGNEMAKKLSLSGFVVYAGVRKESDYKNIIAQAEKLGTRNLLPLYLDVTSTESIKNAVEEVKKKHDCIFSLVNNAGVAKIGPVEHVGVEAFRASFEANFFGVINLTQAFLPLLKASKKDARVVMISSPVARMAVPFWSPYSTTKAALVNLSNIMRVELYSENIKVIVVTPGSLKTNMADASDRQAHDLLDAASSMPSYKAKLEAFVKTMQSNKKGDARVIGEVLDEALLSKWPRLSYGAGETLDTKIVGNLPQVVMLFMLRLMKMA